CCVVEGNLNAARNLTHIEIVVHEYKDVNVVRDGFGGYKGPEDYEAGQVAAGLGQSVNMLQPPRDALALRCAGSEVCNHLSQRARLHTRRHISAGIEFRPSS